MSDLGLQLMALNFSWLEEGLVAGCRGPRTDKDLALLRSVGVRALVRLAGEAETGLTSADVERNAIRDCYEPVPDWTAPSQAQIKRVVRFINKVLANGKPAAVSCGAGCGRTGTILSSYLVWRGLSPESAIETLINARPCSREILSVPGQREAVFEFHRRMRKVKQDGDAV
jgi:atypical dual specificity phosphatase